MARVALMLFSMKSGARKPPSASFTTWFSGSFGPTS
jgi:hypothetical protein